MITLPKELKKELQNINTVLGYLQRSAAGEFKYHYDCREREEIIARMCPMMDFFEITGRKSEEKLKESIDTSIDENPREFIKMTQSYRYLLTYKAFAKGSRSRGEIRFECEVCECPFFVITTEDKKEQFNKGINPALVWPEMPDTMIEAIGKCICVECLEEAHEEEE